MSAKILIFSLYFFRYLSTISGNEEKIGATALVRYSDVAEASSLDAIKMLQLKAK